jgi:hypothetical protein
MLAGLEIRFFFRTLSSQPRGGFLILGYQKSSAPSRRTTQLAAGGEFFAGQNPASQSGGEWVGWVTISGTPV